MSDFVSFELAKRIKEKGFPQHWSDDAYIVENEYDDNFEVGSRYDRCFIPEHLPTISAPTISQVLKWLREEKRLEANGCYDNDEQGWMGYVCEMDVPDLYAFHALKERHKLYEQAAVAAIEYILNNNLI